MPRSPRNTRISDVCGTILPSILTPCRRCCSPDSIRLPPAELLDAEAAQQFIRCHQSYWVNFRQIETMENDCFLLPGGLRVPISRTYRSTAREQFFSRLQI